MDVVGVEGVDADSLAYWVHRVSVNVVHRIMHHGHRGLGNHDRRVCG